MKMKKLSVKALMSLILSAILFCMPIGAFFANRTNTIEVHAEDTAEQKTESAAEEGSAESTAFGTDNKDSSGSGENHTEQSTENTTENSTEGTTEETQPAAKCTCKEKCSQYAVDEDCEVCAKNYKECTYINPSVKITINTPSGWHNDTTKVIVKVEDTIVSGNFTVQTVKAKVGQNGSWTDITEDMYIEISENSTIYVQVTDQKGKTYDGLKQRFESSRYTTTYNDYYQGPHFKFADAEVTFADRNDAISATTIELPFKHNGSTLKYNEETGTYDYYEYGSAHKDAASGEQLTFENVILQNTTFADLGEGYLIYNAIDSGRSGYYITEGKAIEVNWTKSSENAITHYYDAKTGEEIEVNTGKTYISLIPSDGWNNVVIK